MRSGREYLTYACWGLAVILVLLLLVVGALTAYSLAPLPTNSYATTVTSALVVSIEPPWDTIDDGAKECVLNALSRAEAEGKALIVKVDSYGGLLDAGFIIGDAFASSHIPVIAYVSGGKALSAATLIILPTNVIALSPQAIIGAMQPVLYNPTTGEVTFVNESKIINPVVTKSLSYAELRGRNATLVEEFVMSAKTINAQEAVKYGVADLIVTGMNDLLSKLRGIKVNTTSGTYILEISNVENYECSVRSRALSLFENPMISSVLMTIGILGTLFALLSGKLPVLPVALLFLLLGLIGSGFNPNLVAVAFLVLGAVMLAVEIFVTPGFGALGISGIILIGVGIALSPINVPAGTSPPPNYVNQLRTMALVIGGGLGAFTGLIIYKVVKLKRSKPTKFTPEGKVGRAVDNIGPGEPGFVLVDGEYWKAISDEEISAGSKVKVVAMDGTALIVKRVGEED